MLSQVLGLLFNQPECNKGQDHDSKVICDDNSSNKSKKRGRPSIAEKQLVDTIPMSRSSSNVSVSAVPGSSTAVTGNDLSTDMNDIETDAESNYNSNTSILPSKRKRGRPPKLSGGTSGTATAASLLMSPIPAPVIPNTINLNPIINSNNTSKSVPSTTMKSSTASIATVTAVTAVAATAAVPTVTAAVAAPKKQSTHRMTEMKLSLQHPSNDSFDFVYGSKNIGSVRRSRRYRPPDPSRDIPIIYPQEDAVLRFNINESEVIDFTACLNDPIDLIELDEDNENHLPKKHFDPLHAMVATVAAVEPQLKGGGDIFVPGVVEITPTLLSSSNGAMVLTLPELGTELPEYRYNDYDVDEEDMSFLAQLNHHLSLNNSSSIGQEEMERYLTILEREVESSLPYNDIMRQSKYLQDDCEAYIQDIQSHLRKITAFVGSLSETGEVTKDTELLIESVQREEDSSSPQHAAGGERETVTDNSAAQLIAKIKSYLPADVLSSEVNELLEHSHALCQLVHCYYHHHSDHSLPEDIQAIPVAVLQAIAKIYEYYIRKRAANAELDIQRMFTAVESPLSPSSSPLLLSPIAMTHIPPPPPLTLPAGAAVTAAAVAVYEPTEALHHFQSEEMDISRDDLNELKNVLMESDLLSPLLAIDDHLSPFLPPIDPLPPADAAVETAFLPTSSATDSGLSTAVEPTALLDSTATAAEEDSSSRIELSKCSYLRCYHDFMMDNWTRAAEVIPYSSVDLLSPQQQLQQQHQAMEMEEEESGGVAREESAANGAILPALNLPYLTEQETLLRGMRKDLDKARLITDRVRRREKIKKDIIRLTSEYFNTISLQEASLTAATATGGDSEMDTDSMGFTLEYVPFSNLSAPSKDVPVSTAYENFVAIEPRGRGRPRIYPVTIPPSPSVPSAAIATPAAATATVSTIASSSTGTATSTTRMRSSSVTKMIQSTSAVTNWGQDEDTLLLLGIACCGVGKWTEIREDFALGYRTSAQMNQRFSRLAKRRIAFLQGESSLSLTGTTGATGEEELTSAGAGTGGAGTGGAGTGGSSSYGNVTTNTSEQVSKAFRKKLSVTLNSLLETFTDKQDLLWNRISLRYLLDLHQQEKKSSGRPIKHPMQIPIPREYKQKGFLKFKHLLLKRPSSPNFKIPTAASLLDTSLLAAASSATAGSGSELLGEKIGLTRSNSSLSAKSIASSSTATATVLVEGGTVNTRSTRGGGGGGGGVVVSQVRTSPRLSLAAVAINPSSQTAMSSSDSEQLPEEETGDGSVESKDDQDEQEEDEERTVLPQPHPTGSSSSTGAAVAGSGASYNGRGTGKYVGLGKGWRKGLGKKQLSVVTQLDSTTATSDIVIPSPSSTSVSNSTPTPTPVPYTGHGTGQYRGLGKGWRKGLGKRQLAAVATAAVTTTTSQSSSSSTIEGSLSNDADGDDVTLANDYSTEVEAAIKLETSIDDISHSVLLPPPQQQQLQQEESKGTREGMDKEEEPLSEHIKTNSPQSVSTTAEIDDGSSDITGAAAALANKRQRIS